MDVAVHHRRARERGVKPILYWLVRAVFQPFFHLYFRLSRIGREHIPQDGPVILAANHRSFLDPFVIGTCLRRPLYYVAKEELFRHRLAGWFLGSLGAFPVARGNGDGDMVATAKTILDRGDCVVIFPEGTRVRPGPLRAARRGVGRLALETGAPVVPVSVIGSEAVRRGWRIRPHKVRMRVGRPLTFPLVEAASPQLAQAVTDRIWPCVELQWEWLGGVTPHRRAAVVGAGAWGTALAVVLARAGLRVQLGCRTPEQAAALAVAGENAARLPGVALPREVDVVPAADLDLAAADLLVLAVPSRELPAALAVHAADARPDVAVLVTGQGLVGPHGTLPSAAVAERLPAAATLALGGPARPADLSAHGASLVLAGESRTAVRRLADVLAAAGCDVHETADLVGVELAGVAKNAASLAAAAAAPTGPNAAGAAAGKVFAELEAYSRACGGRPETFAGPAGAGDLVATVLAAERRPADAVEAVPLLAGLLAEAGVPAPALSGLADLVEGRVEAEAWAAGITRPAEGRSRVRTAA